MKRCILLAALLCFSVFAEAEKPPAPPPGFGDDTPPERPKAETPKRGAKPVDPLADLKALGEKERLSRIEKLEGTIKPSNKNTLATHFREVLAQLKSQKNKYVPSVEAKEGSVGRIRWKTEGYYKPNDFGPWELCIPVDGRVHIFQIVNESAMIVKGFDGDYLWITGHSTKDLIDDKDIDLNGLFKYGGTKTYETATGSKTVYVFDEIGAD